MNNKIYDICIIGGGPAGSTVARYLDKKYKVIIIDKKNKDTSDQYEKCCGGLLAPDAQKMLAKLNLGVPKSVLEDPQIFAVKTHDFDNNLTRFYQRYYINVNRAKFDRWLLSLIPDEVEISYNSVYKDYEKEGKLYKVNFVSNQKSKNIYCKILIGADGAISKVRKQAFNSPIADKYVSIQKWYKTKKDMPYFLSIFDSEITDFYSWAIKKDKHLIIGSAFKNGDDPNKKFDLLINKLISIGYDIGDEIKKEGAFINRTRKINQIALVSGQVALVGEAASLISPSSAEGISYALSSGYKLAKAINKGIPFKKTYKKSMKKLALNIFMKNIKIPVMYNKLIRKIIMKLKIKSLSIYS